MEDVIDFGNGQPAAEELPNIIVRQAHPALKM